VDIRLTPSHCNRTVNLNPITVIAQIYYENPKKLCSDMLELLAAILKPAVGATTAEITAEVTAEVTGGETIDDLERKEEAVQEKPASLNPTRR